MERKVEVKNREVEARNINIEKITNEPFDEIIGHSTSERKYFTIENNDKIYKRFRNELKITYLPYLGPCVDFGLGDICLEESDNVFKFYIIDRTDKMEYQEFKDLKDAIERLISFYKEWNYVDDSNKMRDILYQTLNLTRKEKNSMERKEELEKLLIVVDMVNGFIKKGNMADPYINHITPALIKLIEEKLNEGEGIAFIKDTHYENSSEFKKFPPHCIKGSGEEELIDELKGYEKYGLSYEKNSTSTIFAKNFLKDIESMKKLREVIVTGCCTDICVLNLVIPLINYFDENNKDVQVTVRSDLVETYNSPNHNREEYNEMALKLMRQAGAKVEGEN